MFHKWLNAARARRHKRVLLLEKQVEFDRATMQVVWDRWREKFMEERLHPIVSPCRTCARMTAVIYEADVGDEGPPGSSTEPEKPRLPCLWDLAFQDESE